MWDHVEFLPLGSHSGSRGFLALNHFMNGRWPFNQFGVFGSSLTPMISIAIEWWHPSSSQKVGYWNLTVSYLLNGCFKWIMWLAFGKKRLLEFGVARFLLAHLRESLVIGYNHPYHPHFIHEESKVRTHPMPHTHTHTEKFGDRGGFKYFFYFHPYLGKITILTHIFQMGWNH